MVARVSPSWTSTAASRVVSSTLNPFAMAFATAVMDVVSWQEFITIFLYNNIFRKDILLYYIQRPKFVTLKKSRRLARLYSYPRTTAPVSLRTSKSIYKTYIARRA